MIELLRRSHDFRNLFTAHAVSKAGDAFNTVGLVVLVFRLTGSGLGAAGTVAFEVLPLLVLGPVAGAVADRFPRRHVMIAADVWRAALVFALAAYHDSTAFAYFVALGLSIGSVSFGPAASSVVPEVVEDAKIVDANSALWSVAVVLQIVMAPVAGLLIASVGVGAAFSINGVSFVGSALVLSRLRTGRAPASAEVAGWRGLASGVTTVRRDRFLTRLAVVQLLAALSAGATSGLLVVLAERRLGVGPTGFGLLLAAIGIGAALGPLITRRWLQPGARLWLFGPLALRGVTDLLLAGLRDPYAAGGSLAAYGIGTSMGTVAFQSTLQTRTPSQIRGRVFAVFDVLWSAGRLLSLMIGGLIVDAAGIQTVYVIGGALLLVAATLGSGQGTRARHPVPRTAQRD